MAGSCEPSDHGRANRRRRKIRLRYSIEGSLTGGAIGHGLAFRYLTSGTLLNYPI